MDTDKIINNIIDQSNVNQLKNELINMKGYLNTIDVKITSLNNEKKDISKQIEEVINSILDLKDQILSDSNIKYEKLLEKLKSKKLKRMKSNSDSQKMYETAKKRTLWKKTELMELEDIISKKEKQYEESVIKENEFKNKYEKDIQVFLHVIQTFLEDNKREYIFDEKEKNPFDFYKTIEYFDAELLEKLILLFETREKLIRKYISIQKQLNTAINEKQEVEEKIKELDSKVTILLNDRENCIDGIKKIVGKTVCVVETGVKGATNAYKFLKDKVISNMPLEGEETIKEVGNDTISHNKQDIKDNNQTKKNEEQKNTSKGDFKNKVVEVAVETAMTEGKKRVKSFFKDFKNNF